MAAKKNTAPKTATKKPAKAVKPIPKGYGAVTATMNQADASATIAFCKKVFGAKVRMKMGAPGGKLFHAEIEIGDSVVMVSDAMRDPARVASLFVYVPKVDKTIAKAVAAGATVTSPAQDMFWGDRVGHIVDAAGNIWAIATHIENVRPDEMKKRMKLAAKQMAK
jgi:PhnB protein